MQDRRQRRAFAAEIALLGFVVACGPGGADRPTDGRDRGPAAAGAPAEAAAAGAPGSTSSPRAEAPVSARPIEPVGGEGVAPPTARAGATPEAPTPTQAERGAEEEGGSPSPAAGAADDRADRLADLELLCAALRRDYVDGTLTDYYGGLAPRTAFGQELRRRGEASMTPGRLLEAALRDLSKKPGDPATPACDALVGELDELE